jgi:hypothetical protein
MSKGNYVKSELLGMKFGTAANKLRKELMFKLVQELDKDICLRCGKKIETVKEFSIDHITSWQTHENPLETFFDLDNIAFSHLKCNIAEGGGHNKIIAPPGKAWCNICKKFIDIKKFSKNRYQHHGLEKFCKKCRKDRWHDKGY